jgi:hypothetical protein
MNAEASMVGGITEQMKWCEPCRWAPSQCCKISFSKVNYDVISKLLIWGLPWVNSFEAWNFVTC